jgi:hypothetical protein
MSKAISKKSKQSPMAEAASLKWKPWTDDRKPGTRDFLTGQMLRDMIARPCRPAYAYMFKPAKNRSRTSKTRRLRGF